MRIELKDENQEEPKQIDENDIHNKHESDLTEKGEAPVRKREAGRHGPWRQAWLYLGLL